MNGGMQNDTFRVPSILCAGRPRLGEKHTHSANLKSGHGTAPFDPDDRNGRDRRTEAVTIELNRWYCMVQAAKSSELEFAYGPIKNETSR